MAPTTGVVRPLGLLAASLLTTAALGEGVDPRAALPDGFAAAPYYPTPYTGWVANWTESVQKAKALVDTMTLAEKANITAGTGFYMGEFTLSAYTGCLTRRSSPPPMNSLLTTAQSEWCGDPKS